MKRVHIVGRKNSGKTTLIVELVAHFCAQGLSVGTIKHTHHRHELDSPGKDSHRHRLAGAATVAVMTPELIAIYRRSSADPGDARYAALESAFADCDLVLVEGDLAVTAPKVEVWRKDVDEPPYAAANRSIAAVITNDALQLPAQHWPRQPIAEVARRIHALAGA